MTWLSVPVPTPVVSLYGGGSPAMVPEPAPLVSLAVWERERLSLYGLPLSVSLYGRERLYGKGSQRSPRKGDPWERDKPSACSLSLSLSLSQRQCGAV
mmetsp:Transcript_33028/g.75544  ORF Transcript_33028/g.75544 Transcript_33028/m.75544 type:complete len:98 (-) Transcript_33028:1-294(-)